MLPGSAHYKTKGRRPGMGYAERANSAVWHRQFVEIHGCSVAEGLMQVHGATRPSRRMFSMLKLTLWSATSTRPSAVEAERLHSPDSVMHIDLHISI